MNFDSFMDLNIQNTRVHESQINQTYFIRDSNDANIVKAELLEIIKIIFLKGVSSSIAF